jgi:DNA-binding transcriptional regulator YhcF (GntR family)
MTVLAGEVAQSGADRVAPGQVVHLPKIAELVAAVIRRQIIDGSLRDGDRLPRERDLMAQYGCSRPSLRQAMRILEHEQLIECRRGAGAVVRAPSAIVCARFMRYLPEMQGASSTDVEVARVISTQLRSSGKVGGADSGPNKTLELIDEMLGFLGRPECST